MKSRLKGKKKNRIITAVSAQAVIIATIGAIAANEVTEEVYYETPKLYQVQGAESYDLTAEISFEADKYTLDVVDMGGFDINVPDSHEITYSLNPIPKAPENTLPRAPSEEAPAEGGNTAPEAVPRRYQGILPECGC